MRTVSARVSAGSIEATQPSAPRNNSARNDSRDTALQPAERVPRHNCVEKNRDAAEKSSDSPHPMRHGGLPRVEKGSHPHRSGRLKNKPREQHHAAQHQPTHLNCERERRSPHLPPFGKKSANAAEERRRTSSSTVDCRQSHHALCERSRSVHSNRWLYGSSGISSSSRAEGEPRKTDGVASARHPAMRTCKCFD